MMGLFADAERPSYAGSDRRVADDKWVQQVLLVTTDSRHRSIRYNA